MRKHWLDNLRWVTVLLVLFYHVINGELTWRFPFFTALGQTGGADAMLHEILTVGVPMSVVLTVVWAIYALVKESRRHLAADRQL